MGEVKSLFRGCDHNGEPVASCVETLRRLLEQAESGELVGITYAGITQHGVGVNGIAGVVGGYSMLGALELAKGQLVGIMLEIDE